MNKWHIVDDHKTLDIMPKIIEQMLKFNQKNQSKTTRAKLNILKVTTNMLYELLHQIVSSFCISFGRIYFFSVTV